VITTIFLLYEEGKFIENMHYQSYWMSGKDGCKFTPEAGTRSDILYLCGQGNLYFYQGKVREF